MTIMFNTIMYEAGLMVADVRLLRHKENQSKKKRSQYELWRDNRPQFELYQSTQLIKNRHKFNAPFWAVFVVNTENETTFAGLYSAKYHEIFEHDIPSNFDDVEKAGNHDVFDLELLDVQNDLIGKLVIDWGPAYRSWVLSATHP
ncbi:MAG: hypothetical protein NTV01_20185 [Bacteroidia bacterium]|nr:hypothetical protein [Bacteroidia bacterium]